MYLPGMVVFALLSSGFACNVSVDGCQIVSWTEWTSCEDGYNCVQGERIKKAGICCDLNENLNHCKNRCNMTTADVTVKGSKIL